MVSPDCGTAAKTKTALQRARSVDKIRKRMLNFAIVRMLILLLARVTHIIREDPFHEKIFLNILKYWWNFFLFFCKIIFNEKVYLFGIVYFRFYVIEWIDDKFLRW